MSSPTQNHAAAPPRRDTFSVPDRRKGERTARPRSAATLILVRRPAAGGEIEVLMGQRHEAHRFMPRAYVFPGGRVDRADNYIEPAAPLKDRVLAQLAKGITSRRAQALALAAVRETFEETGLILGKPCAEPARTKSRAWASFFARGVAPRIDTLEFVARAVTPPTRAIRFDARFFMTDARHLFNDGRGLEGSGELEDIRWVPLSETKSLPLPAIQSRVLDEIEEMTRMSSDDLARRRVPSYTFRYGRNAVAYL